MISNIIIANKNCRKCIIWMKEKWIKHTHDTTHIIIHSLVIINGCDRSTAEWAGAGAGEADGDGRQGSALMIMYKCTQIYRRIYLLISSFDVKVCSISASNKIGEMHCFTQKCENSPFLTKFGPKIGLFLQKSLNFRPLPKNRTIVGALN